ncbi:MAG TPA: hypothetical protein VH083_12140, partial [Myxococcales bacterium]|nr:hypothetical protein [Myxococcales bacterium]
ELSKPGYLARSMDVIADQSHAERAPALEKQQATAEVRPAQEQPHAARRKPVQRPAEARPKDGLIDLDDSH